MITLRVTTVQFELRAEPDFAAFARHLTDIVESAVADGAELVVFPELCTTGLLASHPQAAELTVNDLSTAYREVFPALTEPLTELLSTLAVEHGITVLGGSHFRRADDGTYRNTAHLAHPDGRVERQDKLHLTAPERAMGLQPGDDVLITNIGRVKAAIQICADIEFPEIGRYLTMQGVELILCPSLTWNTRGAHRVSYGSHARAMENQLFVVTAPLVGTSGLPTGGAIHGTGNAMICGPIDRTVGFDDGVIEAHPDTRAEGTATATLDFDVIARSRANPEPPGLSNLRPELYTRFAAFPVTELQ
jgi:predicted amidohydrolase